MGQPWSFHVNPLQHSISDCQDRVQQGYVADRPCAAQQTSYADARVRQAVDNTVADLGCDGAFEGAHAENFGAADAVSEQLNYPAALCDPMQGAHIALIIGKLPQADTALHIPSPTADQWMRLHLCMQGRPMKLLL